VISVVKKRKKTEEEEEYESIWDRLSEEEEE